MARPKKGAGKGRGGRRSKAESMTGANDSAVEVRTIGDNSTLPLPEPTDWNHHKKTIAGFREKVTTAQGLLRNAIKTAKKAGINMESLNLVVGIERENDPVKAKSFFDQVGMGFELGESTLRITTHDTLLGDATEVAHKRGFDDGKNGRSSNGRYPEGSDLAEAYSKGWQEGMSENVTATPEQREELAAAE